MPSMDSPCNDSQLHSNQQQQHQHSQFDRAPSNDDFLDQMLSSISSWPDLPQVNTKFPWDNNGDRERSNNDSYSAAAYDEPSSFAGRLRQHHQLMPPAMVRNGETGLTPLSLGTGDSSDCRLPVDPPGDGGVSYGLGQRVVNNQQHFSAQQNYGGPSPTSPSATSGGANPPRQKVRARRGQATDPHSIAERLRRERIAERMKALQELVPNANKTDKASMLDEIIDYVKFLQLQVKVLSMSRLGGAAGVVPLMASMSSERSTTRDGGGVKEANPRSSSAISGAGNGVAMTEHQVAKLMEDDMGSAMQYLQGKGLCLMPISLASAISTATSTHSRTSSVAAPTPHCHLGNAGGLLGHMNYSGSSGEGPLSGTAEGMSSVTKEGSSTKSDA